MSKYLSLKILLFLFSCYLMLSCNNQNRNETLFSKEKAAKDIFLLTPDGVHKKMIDSSVKLNMLVFWASWCKPCSAEIPILTKLHQVFKDSSFQMASISMDADINAWKYALIKEKMIWQQFIASKSEVKKLDSNYSIPVIPTIIFTDREGKLIYRMFGFDSTTNFKQKVKIIDSLLKVGT